MLKYMLHSVGLIFFVCLTSFSIMAEATKPDIRPNMEQIVAAFSELERFTVSQEKFMDSANDAAIRSALGSLGTNFYEVFKSSAHGNRADPGFQLTLRIVDEMLNDARNRFNEGKKGYALWRLRTTANHCVTCHTRYEIPAPFVGATLPDELKDDYAKGEFYLATRQFELASQFFMRAAKTPVNKRSRLDALRQWLIIQTRVAPDPKGALLNLRKFTSQTKLNSLELETVSDWSQSLARWQDEKVVQVDPIVKAESLVRQGLGSNDLLYANVGAVELLRATSLLHKMLEDKTTKEDKGRALYLLGLAYSRLPLFFLPELPEMFLEQAIREVPGSDDARRAYKLYTEEVTLGYTGSSGTELPDDVQLRFRELYDLAYSVKGISDRV